MAKYRMLVMSLAAAAALACSCAPKAVPPSPARTGNVSYDAVWDAAVSVLWEYGFTLDRMDRRSGIITTAPLTGKYMGEFWRNDAATTTDTWEGTLQTVFRQATVHLVPVGTPTSASGPATYPTSRPAANTPFVARVEVHVSRSDRPYRNIESTADAQRMFLRPQSVDLEGIVEHRGDVDRKKEAPNYNADLGRDAKLEALIEGKINERSVLGVPAR